MVHRWDDLKKKIEMTNEIREMSLDGLGCTRKEDCKCFHCCITGVLEGTDEIESYQLREILGGLMQSLLGKNIQKKDILTPEHFAGIAHGWLLAFDCMNIPTFITQDPGLIRSTILHMMRKSAERVIPDIDKRMNDALREHRASKSNGEK